MSVLSTPPLAGLVARSMQGLLFVAEGAVARRRRAVFPDIPGNRHGITVPTSVAPARAAVYYPKTRNPRPPVHVNFHGGGFVLPGIWLDDPLCRYLAAESGVVVVNVDYVVAPQHQFPAAPHQAFEVIRWVAEHGEEHGWDGSRLTIGGQSAGAALAAAAARQSLELGGPEIALQVLHYPPLDFTIPTEDKPSVIDKPMLRPWMGKVFDANYVPAPAIRADRLISPAGQADTADLRGIAPALIVTPEYDVLRDEAQRYAERLRRVDALLEHRDVPQRDHGYDVHDVDTARDVYAVMAGRIKAVTQSSARPGQ